MSSFFGLGGAGMQEKKTPEQIQADKIRREQKRQEEIDASNAFSKPTRLGRTLVRTPSNLSAASGGASVCRSSSSRRSRSRSASVTRGGRSNRALKAIAATTGETDAKRKQLAEADAAAANGGILGNVVGHVMQSLSNPTAALQQSKNQQSGTETPLASAASFASAAPPSPIHATLNTSETKEALSKGDAALARALNLVGAPAPAPVPVPGIENVQSDLTEATDVKSAGSATGKPTVDTASPALAMPSLAANADNTASSSNARPSSTPRQGLDLTNNDLGFHAIASVIVDRYINGITEHEEKFHIVTTEEHTWLDRTIQPRVRENLVDAIRQRLKTLPKDSQKPIHQLVRNCQKLGLHREGDENILFAPAFATVVFNRVDPEPEPEPEEPVVVEKTDADVPGPMSDLSGAATVGSVGVPAEAQDLADAKQEAAAVVAMSTPTPVLEDTSPEALARKQLLAELREASNMMAESVTPEAAQFWRNHVVDLQARLRALHGEGAGDIPELAASISKGDSVAAPAPSPAVQQPVVSDPSLQSAAGSDVSGLVTVPAVNSVVSQPSTNSEPPPPPTPNRKAPVQPPIQPRGAVDELDPALADAPIMDVIAPADLPGGSTFEVEIEGRGFLATVPAGGVRSGETFCCYMRELEAEVPDVPVGRWKDSFCSCLTYGLCHPALLNAVFCPLIALAQVMSRLDLDFMGRQTKGQLPTSTFSMITGILVFWSMMNIAIFAAYNYKWRLNMEISVADISAILFLNVCGFLYVVVATTVTRMRLRERYAIQGGDCPAVTDAIGAACFLPCSISQMARHTGAYHKYNGVCCSENGLPDHATFASEPAMRSSSAYMV